VQQIDSCVRELHLHKASGPDDLVGEHLVYAHPSLTIHLKLLFSLIVAHGFVPHAFGQGIIVPLVKDKNNNINNISNYRPITLTPVISKVFEALLLRICEGNLVTSDLQFGFKKGIGCPDVIFSVRTVVNHFVERGSSVYAATLDLRKAFDSVNHSKLYETLRQAGIPLPIIDVIRCWYSKMFVTVRWNDCLSDYFYIPCGVRQGSVISPYLFNLFINVLICQLKLANIGCHIENNFYGCFLYADDIIILSPSVLGLQSLLNLCTRICANLHLHFNHEKSYCIVFGKRRVHDIAPMLLGDALLPWVDSVRYLGVYIVGNNKLSFDFAYTKRCFYAAFNNIMSHARSLEQIIQLSLVESYCLPVLTYAIGTLSVTQRQLHDLNVCWNTAYRVIFGFNRWESVKCFICGMGRLSLIYIIKLHRINFFFRLLQLNHGLLFNMFFLYMRDNYKVDDCLSYIFYNKADAVSDVYGQFAAFVS
jgi:hypothetical protein